MAINSQIDNEHELWNCLQKDPVAKTSQIKETSQKEINEAYKQYLENRDLLGSIWFFYNKSNILHAVDLETKKVNCSALDLDSMSSLIYYTNELFSEAIDTLIEKDGAGFPFRLNEENNVMYKQLSINLDLIYSCYKELLEEENILDKMPYCNRLMHLGNIISTTKKLSSKLQDK